MSYLRTMVKQVSHYIIAYALSMIAGLISFPIYTRIFSVHDYGYLSLIATVVFFVMAVGKLGLQNSIIRFYEDIKNRKKNISLTSYYSTLFFGPLLIIGTLCMLYTLGIFIFAKFVLNTIAAKYFFLSAIWAFFLCSNTILKNFLRAEHNTKLYNLLGIISKYSSLVLAVSLVIFVFGTLTGLYIAFIITELLIFIYLAYRLWKKHPISINEFDTKFFREALFYGLPFTGAELTNITLNAGDRFIILYFINNTAVGLYSAGYNLGMYAMEAFTSPLSFAIVPMFMKIWTEKGAQETKIFLQKCLRFFLMVTLPCLFAFIYLSKEIIILLASQRFEGAHAVIPFVSIGMFLFGLSYIFSAGLVIYKKSNVLAITTFAAGIVNIILNIILIPRYGIVAAAITTLISYMLLFVLVACISFKYLSFTIDYYKIAKYIIFSIAMILVMDLIHGQSIFLFILIKVLVGFGTYTLLLYVLDCEARLIMKDIFFKKLVGIFNMFSVSCLCRKLSCNKED